MKKRKGRRSMRTDKELEVDRDEGIDFTRRQCQIYLQPDDLLVAVCKKDERFAVMITRYRKSDVELFRTGYWIEGFAQALDIIEKTLRLVQKRGDRTGHTLKKEQVLNADLIELIMSDLRAFGVSRTSDFFEVEVVSTPSAQFILDEQPTVWMMDKTVHVR